MKLYQPDLFSAPSISYNKAIRNLQKLRPADARYHLMEYQGYVPEENLELEYSALEFISDWAVQDAIATDPETAMDLFEQWTIEIQPLLERRPQGRQVVEKIQRGFFKRVSETLLDPACPAPDPSFMTQGRAVKCLMMAARWNRALRLCEQLADYTDRPARIAAYMGDSLYELGMKNASRSAYLKACIIAPDEIEAYAVRDTEIRELFTSPESLCDEHDIPDGPWRNHINWTGAIGIATGLLPLRPDPRLLPLSGLQEIFYSTDSKEIMKQDHMVTRYHYSTGQCFAAGIILSYSSGPSAVTGPGAHKQENTTMDIRRATMKLAPELFSIILSRLT